MFGARKDTLAPWAIRVMTTVACLATGPGLRHPITPFPTTILRWPRAVT
jgi:hypothetical protein